MFVNDIFNQNHTSIYLLIICISNRFPVYFARDTLIGFINRANEAFLHLVCSRFLLSINSIASSAARYQGLP